MNSYYLLCIVNHRTRQYNLRVEDDRGDPGTGSKHSLAGYLVYMAYSLNKADRGEVKDHWMHPFWRELMRDPANCEQIVVARIEAADVKSARGLAKPHRNLLKQFYRGLGYKSFYPDDKSLDPEDE